MAAVVLLATGVVGFSELWGFDSLTGFYHVGVGMLFAYAGFWQRDTTSVRQMVGGLGVLLLGIKAVTIVTPLSWGDPPQHGPIELTCLVVGIGSVLVARYLRDGESGGGSGRS